MSARLRTLFDRRVAAMLLLGFSSGLPLLLVLGTFTTRLAFSDVDIRAIGLFSYLALPYSLKFLWAPAIDRFDVPLLSAWLGRRRAWMVVAQLGVAAALVLMASADPKTSLELLGLGAFLVAFAAATQDIVIDGWRIKAAGTERQGVMAATSNLGYRLALITAGAGALILADRAGWTVAYLTMAALMGIGLLATLFAPPVDADAPPDGPPIAPVAEQGPARPNRFEPYRVPVATLLLAMIPLSFWLGWAQAQAVIPAAFFIAAVGAYYGPGALAQGEAGGRGAAIGRALAAPVAELASRYGPGLVAILILVALYRMPDFVSGVMASPLYRTLGYSLTEIAAVTKLYGIWVGIGGSFVGGWAIVRFGLHPTLVVGGALAAFSHLSLAWLSYHGPDVWTFALPGWLGGEISLPWRLALAISIENFCGSFAGISLIAFMSGLTSPAFAAAQYALLSSLYALPGKLLAGLSGFMVTAWGYPAFFTFTATFGVPVTLLALLFGRAGPPKPDIAPAQVEPAPAGDGAVRTA